MSKQALYVVATPIGNLDDVTGRALTVLAEVDLIAAEDTRRTRVLLDHYRIDRPLLALQEHNEERQAPRLVERLLGGEAVALVSDAGTPLLSDPGYRLVALAAAAGIEVVPVPGPSAVTAALSVAGLPTDRFVFEGFLKSRPAARRGQIEALRGEQRTLVLFESSHRIRDSLQDLADGFGADRKVALCREMTKRFETVLRGSLAEILDRISLDADQRKGEFVLVIAGAAADTDEALSGAVQLARALLPHLPASQAARVAAGLHGASRREVYRRLEED